MRRSFTYVNKNCLLKALRHQQIFLTAQCSTATVTKESTIQDQNTSDRTNIQGYQTQHPTQTSDSSGFQNGGSALRSDVTAEPAYSGEQVIKRCVVKNEITSDVKPFSAMPGPKGIYKLPIIGSMIHFKPFTNHTLKTIHDLYGDLLKRYGPIVRVQFGRWMVLLEDPDDIGVVFQNEGRYPKRPTADLHKIYCQRNKVAPGVATRDNEDWHTLRRAINIRMMKADAALKYLDIQNEVADDLVRRFQVMNFTPGEMKDEFFKYATESISALAFNKRLGFLDDTDDFSHKRISLESLRKLFELFNESFYVGYGLYKHFKTPFYKRYEKMTNEVFGFTNSVLDDCLQEIKKSGRLNENNSFLETMLSQEGITLDDIRTVIIDLFVAGTDSTAKNLQMVLYTIARHPDQQKRLYEEIKSVMGTSGPLTVQSLSQMQFLKACVKESFRMNYPTSTGTTRFLPKDIVLRGYKVPKNTLIVMCNHRTVKNEKYFNQPEEFLPERWLRNEQGHRQAAVHPMAFLPFGFGPRSCLGRRFAEQEVYLAITKILQSFEVSLEPGFEDINVEYTVFITTKDPIHFVFKKRKN